MAPSPRLLRPLFVTSCALALLACGGTAVTSLDDGAGGTRAHGSGASASATGGQGGGVGGAAVGGASVGGTASGGLVGAGGVIVPDVSCTVDDDCVAVLDGNDGCASAYCSTPIAVSKQAIALDHCLVPWDERYSWIPEDCLPSEPIPCPEFCAGVSCAAARCFAGKCEVKECPSCDVLSYERAKALQAARGCNPALDSLQCVGTESVADECGCPFVVNEQHPELVETAKKARATWAASCPQPACPYGVCAEPTTGYCGADGLCAGGAP